MNRSAASIGEVPSHVKPPLADKMVSHLLRMKIDAGN